MPVSSLMSRGSLMITVRPLYLQLRVRRLMVVKHQDEDTPMLSKLKMLVPTIGMFFTPLPLREAFLTTEPKRAISQRRFVAPSFNGTHALYIKVD